MQWVQWEMDGNHKSLRGNFWKPTLVSSTEWMLSEHFFCTIIHPKVLLYGISISVRGKNCAEIFRPLLNSPMRPEDFFINIYLYTLQLKLLPPKTRMLRNTRCVSVEKASRACKQSALPARVFVAKWRLIRRPFWSLQLHIPRKKIKISICHTCLQAVAYAYC